MCNNASPTNCCFITIHYNIMSFLSTKALSMQGTTGRPRCNTNKSNNEKFQLLQKLCHLNFKPHKLLHPRQIKDTTFTDENFSIVN